MADNRGHIPNIGGIRGFLGLNHNIGALIFGSCWIDGGLDEVCHIIFLAIPLKANTLTLRNAVSEN
ncbi:hypothetical protein [Citrobacter portucalensis]|uniref:hypothetical protein n=1 Tax=Citrobacter portucalensis TaxID=1639133 RepID=UPI002B255D54|nr:hypothetical protein [Citrobacter portucalensis]MEB1056507.1 hypothetical protein [Citrobacter portucalensis]